MPSPQGKVSVNVGFCSRIRASDINPTSSKISFCITGSCQADDLRLQMRGKSCARRNKTEVRVRVPSAKSKGTLLMGHVTPQGYNKPKLFLLPTFLFFTIILVFCLNSIAASCKESLFSLITRTHQFYSINPVNGSKINQVLL